MEGHLDGVLSVGSTADGFKVWGEGGGTGTWMGRTQPAWRSLRSSPPVSLWAPAFPPSPATSGRTSPRPLLLPPSSPLPLHLPPPHLQLASASLDKTVRLWDLKQEAQVALLKGHSGVFNSVAFSPNGMLLVSGSVSVEDLCGRMYGGAGIGGAGGVLLGLCLCVCMRGEIGGH